MALQNIEALHPGPVDNADIQGPHGIDLRAGLSEGKDFVLLPGNVADYLFETYKVCGLTSTYFSSIDELCDASFCFCF